MSASWYWPPSGLAARGVACVPFDGGLLAVPDWTTPRFFPFVPGVGFGAPIASSGIPGLSSMASDGSGNLWTVSYAGVAWGIYSGGFSVSGALPSGHVYVGVAGPAFNDLPHVMSSDGIVWKNGISGYGELGAWPGAATAFNVSGAAGTSWASLLPASGLLATMSASPVVSTGSIALPAAVSTPSCLSVSGGVAAVGGWQQAPFLSGMACAGLDPQNPVSMLAAGSGTAVLWQAPSATSEAWAQTQALTGLASLASLSWRPDGTQALAASPVSSVVQVLGYSVGVLSLAQTLTISGACSVAVAGTSVNALAAQSGMAQAATLSYGGGAWTTGAAVTGMAGISSVAPFGSSGAVAAVSGGVAFLALLAGAWSLSEYVELGFAPTALAVDPFLRVYAAGSGSLSVLSGATVVGSGAWTGGSPTSCVVQDGRVVLAVPGDGLLRMYGQSAPGAWTQQGSAPLSLGARVGLALSETVMFALGSGATATYGFSGTPYAPTEVLSGAVSRWNGSTWTTTALGIGHLPSSVAFDASGNLWACTVQNTLWSVSSGGAVLSSGTVPAYPSQASGVPMGCSAVCPASGHIFIATSLAGVLVEAE